MSFLALPYEIRFQIYNLVFPPIEFPSDPALDVALPYIHQHEHPFLCVNRQIRAEALHIWLSRSNFRTRTYVPTPYAQAVRHAYNDGEKHAGNVYGRWLEEIGQDDAKWIGRMVIMIVQYLAGEVIVEIPARKGGERDAWPKGKIKIEAAFDKPYEHPRAKLEKTGEEESLKSAVEVLNRSRKTGRITIVSEDVPKFVEKIYRVVDATGKAEWGEYHVLDG